MKYLWLLLSVSAFAQISDGSWSVPYPALNPKADAVISVLWANPVSRDDGLQLLVNQASNAQPILSLKWNGSGDGNPQQAAVPFTASMKRQWPQGLLWYWPDGDFLMVYDPDCVSDALLLYDADGLIVQVKCDGTAKVNKTRGFNPDVLTQQFWQEVAKKWKKQNAVESIPQATAIHGLSLLTMPDWDTAQDSERHH